MMNNILNSFVNGGSLLSENTNIQIPEASEEGFDFESGGISRINSLSESAICELNALVTATEVKGYKALAEGTSTLSEVIQLQESVISSVLEKAKNVIKKLWARMKSVCNSVKLQFERIFSTKGFVADAEKTLSNMTDFSGLELEGYNFTIDAINLTGVSKGMIDEAEKLGRAAMSAADKITVGDKSTVDSINKQINSTVKSAKDELSGEKMQKTISQKGLGCDPSDIDKTIFKKLRNNKDSKDKVTWNKSNCLNAIKNLKTLTNDVNSVAKQVDDIYSEALSKVSKLESEINKGKEGASDVATHLANEKLSIATKTTEAIRYGLAISNKITGAKLQALKDDASQAKSFISKAISQGKKNVKKVSESTDITGLEQYMANIEENY